MLTCVCNHAASRGHWDTPCHVMLAVPILVGCLIFSINSVFGHLAPVYNPAMAFASRVVAMALGGWGLPALAGGRSFVLGSLVGGVVGCKLYQRLVGSREYDKVCSWICAEGPKRE